MEAWPESVNEKLSAWLGPSTWHTRENRDMKKFHEFIDAYVHEVGSSIDAGIWRDQIHSALTKHGHTVSEPIEEIVTKRIHLAENIVEFLKDTNRI